MPGLKLNHLSKRATGIYNMLSLLGTRMSMIYATGHLNLLGNHRPVIHGAKDPYIFIEQWATADNDNNNGNGIVTVIMMIVMMMINDNDNNAETKYIDDDITIMILRLQITTITISTITTIQ